MSEFTHALVVGAGSGLSAALTRRFRREGLAVSLAARNVAKLATLCDETGASAFACDASERGQVVRLFEQVTAISGAPDIVVFNASARIGGPFVQLDPKGVETAIRVSAFAGFLVAQEAVRRMLSLGRGVVVFTGASASVKGYPQSAPFAMGKFALRGLAQSMARELQPQGIHVAHVVIDGTIRSERYAEPADKPGSLLDPAAIADSYWHLIQQPRSAWSWEIELRPWLERF
jgi:NAD(P)-dependent dehydrogenase (short-subunit alcohol dehydrogenase family)